MDSLVYSIVLDNPKKDYKQALDIMQHSKLKNYDIGFHNSLSVKQLEQEVHPQFPQSTLWSFQDYTTAYRLVNGAYLSKKPVIIVSDQALADDLRGHFKNKTIESLLTEKLNNE